MIKVFEAFAGYGSQRMALRNLGIEHEVVAISEFDKYADASYQAIHGETWNMGDITKIDVNDVPDHDLFTYSFPCQDISVAGKGKGFSKDSGTRSGLLWESERIIKAKKPKYLLMENVKNLISEKFMPGFVEWILALEELGYSNYYEVLNAKDFGIPQNRERVFMVSILGEHEPYVFPKPIKLEKRLKDVLEEEVDEKYYLDNKRTQQLIATITDVNGIEQQEGLKMNRNEISGKSDIAQTLLARDYKGFGNQDMNGVIEPEIKQILQYNSENRENTQRFRTYDPSEIAPTLNTMQDGGLEPHIPEPKIAASRGRGKNNEQQLEVNKDETSNALTTVEKDNYVLEGVDVHPFSKKLEFQGYKQKDVSPCLLATDYKVPKTVLEGIPIKNNTDQGYLIAKEGDGVDLAYPTSNTRRGRVQESMSQTLTTDDSKGVVEQYRIRKLTPLECFRLMDVTDEDFYKAQAVNSNTQLYKQAGNSIVVSVLEAIFRNMFLEVPEEDLVGEHIPLF